MVDVVDATGWKGRRQEVGRQGQAEPNQCVRRNVLRR